MVVSVSLTEKTPVPSRKNATLAPGDSLGRFQLVATIAAGGMGKVWAARQRGDRGFQKIVAVKTALETFADHPDFETFFLDEARVASRIDHPNVCSVLDLGEDRGILYLVMEWVGGGSLGQLLLTLPERRLDPRIAARIFAQACAGLHAAHELKDENGNSLGVVHRDISPQNLLLTPEGHVKVADFGVVRAKDQVHQTTNTGEIKGKISYMAPEQLSSARYDRRADIFALGTTLYEATVGVKAYDSAGVTAIYRILKGDHRAPSEVRPDFPPELERIILCAMALDPNDRYATAEDMRAELEAYLAASGPPCTEVDVMKVLDRALGSTVRSRMSGIRTAITRLDANSSEQTGNSGSAGLPAAGDDSVSVQITSDGGSAESPIHRGGTRRKMLWIYAGGFTLAMIAGGATALRGRTLPLRDSSTLAGAASVSASSAPPPNAQPPDEAAANAASAIRVHLRVTPASARISIDDGAPLATPYEATVTRDDRTHTLRAFAPGYDDYSKSVTFDESIELTINLLPTKPVRPAHTENKPVTKTPGVAASSPIHAVTPPPTVATPPGRPRKPIEYGDPLRE